MYLCVHIYTDMITKLLHEEFWWYNGALFYDFKRKFLVIQVIF